MLTVIQSGLAHLNHKKKAPYWRFFLNIIQEIKMPHSILANFLFHLRNFVILGLLQK
ncbi:MAG: hypothetical protein RLZZ577_129 [Bacteroidota bacterium]